MASVVGPIRNRLAAAVRRWNKPRVYRARHGIGRGFRQIGGVGLILPGFLQPAPEYPQFAGKEEAFLRALDLRNEVIYDVGAFVGVFTMFFSRAAGDGGHVVAFEPHPENYERVLEHVRLNGLTNVDLRNVGLGKAPGELQLAAPAHGLGQATADEQIKEQLATGGTPLQTLTVPVNSLDAEIRDSSLPDPGFVKIDVEGLEFDVLEGMRVAVARAKPKLFVEIHGGGLAAKQANAARVVELLTEYGYSLHHVESDQPIDRATSDRAAEGHLYCI
jgi:FkbM family methyltransferase